MLCFLVSCQTYWPQTVPKQTLLPQKTTIPIQFYDHRPVVNLMINGKGPFQIILDTSSVAMALRPSVARQLELPPRYQGRLGGKMLQHFILTIDQRTQLVQLMPNGQ